MELSYASTSRSSCAKKSCVGSKVPSILRRSVPRASRSTRSRSVTRPSRASPPRWKRCAKRRRHSRWLTPGHTCRTAAAASRGSRKPRPRASRRRNAASSGTCRATHCSRTRAVAASPSPASCVRSCRTSRSPACS
eukprot:scaffold1744_cov340-Prasinococcus_capsulatus_cf.AAC.13